MAAPSDDRMFPVLTEEQIETARRYGETVKLEAGEVLFRPGDRGVPFFVVLSGALRATQPDPCQGERLIQVLGPGQFTGEMHLLTQRRVIAQGQMVEPGEVIRVSPDGFRRLLSSEPDLSDVLVRAFVLRRVGMIEREMGGVALLGSHHSADTLRLRRFLWSNGHPHRYVDVEDAGAQELVERYGATPADLPLVFLTGGEVLRNPGNRDVSERLGLSPELTADDLHDVVVVGGGPAGLAAAVYAASEGLDVLVVEEEACGGQAGASSRIENYLGFPTGVSGRELAGRALTQATKFGARIATASCASRLDCGTDLYRIELDDGAAVRARAVVIASGARYRRLGLEGIERFDGQGIYYACTAMEAMLCQDRPVVVVGGGNSAGQAAVFLARRASCVHMLVRGPALAATMSAYLSHRIEADPNIELHVNAEVSALEGESELERLRWRDRTTGEETGIETSHLFVMIGASPNTGWLSECVALDRAGFVKTGQQLDADDLDGWTPQRRPFLMETSKPGVFAVGDVRSGSVKRVASAVGEGSVCVQLLHQVLNGE